MANHTDLYERYFDATFGRHYPDRQRTRILHLIASSFGVAAETEEYDAIFAAAAEVEAQDIDDLNDAKNYLLVCELLNSEPEVTDAAEQLVTVLTAHARQNRPTYSSHLDWVLELRSNSAQYTEEERLDNALLEYSTHDTDTAMSELRILVNQGSFAALAYLAFISEEVELYEDAFHYLQLLKRTYVQEVELSPFAALGRRIASLTERIGKETAARIVKKIDALPPFLTSTGVGLTSIGFGNAAQRRYTYEH